MNAGGHLGVRCGVAENVHSRTYEVYRCRGSSIIAVLGSQRFDFGTLFAACWECGAQLVRLSTARPNVHAMTVGLL